MKIGKLDLKEWTYGGAKLKKPQFILLSIIAAPIYIFGMVIMCFAYMLSEWSLKEAVYLWRKLK